LINGSGQLLAGSTQPETTITSPLRKKVRRETGNAMSRRLVLYINADPETRILGHAPVETLAPGRVGHGRQRAVRHPVGDGEAP
jgi:hypothetical protein